MSVDTRWFQGRLADKKLSQRKLAAELRLDPGAVSLMLHGRRQMSAKEAATVSKVLGVGVDEVLRRAGIMSKMARSKPTNDANLGSYAPSATFKTAVVAGSGAPPSLGFDCPVSGWIDSSGLVRRGDGVLGPKSAMRPTDAPAGVEALRIQTPDVANGWLVYVVPFAGISPEAVGQLCVVDTEDGREMLRNVGRGYAAGEYSLTALFGDQFEVARLRTATPVVWMKQR